MRSEPQRHTDQLDNRVDETLVMLRAAAIEAQMALSGDDRVGEACAARLLRDRGRYARKETKRGKGTRIWCVSAARRCPIALADLDRWIDQQREDFSRFPHRAKSATRSRTLLVRPSNMAKFNRLTATKTPTPRVGANTT
jgi:hypothetical protein